MVSLEPTIYIITDQNLLQIYTDLVPMTYNSYTTPLLLPFLYTVIFTLHAFHLYMLQTFDCAPITRTVVCLVMNIFLRLCLFFFILFSLFSSDYIIYIWWLYFISPEFPFCSFFSIDSLYLCDIFIILLFNSLNMVFLEIFIIAAFKSFSAMSTIWASLREIVTIHFPVSLNYSFFLLKTEHLK